MAYNSTTEIDYAITAATRQRLFTDAGSYVSAAFDQALARASAYLNAALSTAGYPVPVDTASLPTDTVDLLKSLEVAVFVTRNYPRKGLKIPAEHRETMNVLPGIIDGSVPLPGLSPSTATAIGGVMWSGSATSGAGQIDPVFGRADANGDDPLGGY